jgi:hypothetical protein
VGSYLNPNSDAWGGSFGSPSAWGGSWDYSFSRAGEKGQEWITGVFGGKKRKKRTEAGNKHYPLIYRQYLLSRVEKAEEVIEIVDEAVGRVVESEARDARDVRAEYLKAEAEFRQILEQQGREWKAEYQRLVKYEFMRMRQEFEGIQLLMLLDDM